MSIEKFTTEALVLAEYERGESDAMLLLYTRDFGVVNAKQSSLKKSGKLRQHLVVGRYTDVTLVKGREFYRVAGARESSKVYNLEESIIKENVFLNDQQNKIEKERIGNLLYLVKRFLGFENKNQKLYDRLKEYVFKENFDYAVVKLCMLCDILIVGGYFNLEDIDMNLEDYKSSTVDDIYMKIVLNKDEVVKKLRQATEMSML